MDISILAYLLDMVIKTLVIDERTDCTIKGFIRDYKHIKYVCLQMIQYVLYEIYYN